MKKISILLIISCLLSSHFLSAEEVSESETVSSSSIEEKGSFAVNSVKIESTDGFLHENDGKKHWFTAVGGMLFFNVGLSSYNRFVTKSDWAQVGSDEWNRFWERTLEYDRDWYWTNFVLHPYQGSIYYMVSRGSNLTFYESFGVTLLGSAFWEYLCETNAPSINDMYYTSVGSFAVGEMLYRLSLNADELSEILACLEEGKPYGKHEKEKMQIGVTVLPEFNKDTTDRNRTSPFAFTGNKFEFRMLGSNESIACANVFLNTAVADVLGEFADKLEKSKDFKNDLHQLILDTIKEHKRIIFNGNGYDDSWVKEAEKRGLSNLRSTPEALAHTMDEENVKLFEKYGVYSKVELESRYEIHNENYSKIINIEAETMLEMAKKNILPCASKYASKLAQTIGAKKSACGECDCTYEEQMLKKVSALTSSIYEKTGKLESAVNEAKVLADKGDSGKTAFFYREKVFTAMGELRAYADELEVITPKELWPFPSYGDLLYSVR